MCQIFASSESDSKLSDTRPSWCSCCTTGKVVKVSLAVLVISALSITITALMMAYPTTSKIFYGVFIPAGSLSLIHLVCTCINPSKKEEVAKKTAESPQLIETSAPSTNPFAATDKAPTPKSSPATQSAYSHIWT